MIVITSNNFVAGIGLTNGRASEVAPILKYMQGWTVARIKAYAESKAWKFEQHAEETP